MTRFDRTFRLADGPGGLGLACDAETGLSLAGVQLLRITAAGYAPRPISDLGPLMKGAYTEGRDPAGLAPGLDVVAEALNRGDLGRAMIAALRLSDLSADGAAGIASADEVIAKYNFNQDEPQDTQGRWTNGDPASASATRPLRVRQALARPATTADGSGPNAPSPERSWVGPVHLYGDHLIQVQAGGMGGNGPPPGSELEPEPAADVGPIGEPPPNPNAPRVPQGLGSTRSHGRRPLLSTGFSPNASERSAMAASHARPDQVDARVSAGQDPDHAHLRSHHIGTCHTPKKLGEDCSTNSGFGPPAG